MYVSIPRLPAEARGYLRDCVRTQGESTNGLYIRRRRGGALWRLLVALIAAGVAYFAFVGEIPDEMRRGLASIVCATALMSLASALITAQRNGAFGGLGSFTLVDGRYLWEVDEHGAEITDIQSVTRVEFPHGERGRRGATAVHLTGVGLDKRVTVAIRDEKRQAEFVRYLQQLVALRGPSRGESDARIGAAAKAAALGREADSALEKPAAPVVAVASEPRGGLGDAVPLVAGVAGAVIGWAGFMPLYDFVVEEQAYAATLTTNPEHPAFEAYLKQFPNGRRKDDVESRRDTLRFGLGQVGGIDGYRNYLSNPANTRHRDEAKAGVDQLYLAAIAKAKQWGAAEGADQALVDGLVGCLEWSRAHDGAPIVITLRETAPEATTAEEAPPEVAAARDAILAAHPSLAERERGGLLPLRDETSGVFDDGPRRDRQNYVLQAFNTALSRMVGDELFALRPAAEGEAAHIELHYSYRPKHAYADESLRKPVPAEAGAETAEADRTTAWLYGFVVDWHLTFKADEAAVKETQFQTEPVAVIQYGDALTVPVWSPYVGILTSGLDGLAFEVRRRLGVPATTPQTIKTGLKNMLPSPYDAPTRKLIAAP